MFFVKSLDTKLLGLSSYGDCITARDGCDGIHVFGRIGGGKSSGPGRMLAGAYLRAGMGGLVTAVKPGEVEQWRRYAAAHGRGRSVLLFDENEGFNFLDYEMARHGIDGIGTTTECLMRIIDAGRKVSATASKRGGEVFWEDSTREALRYVLPVLYGANGSLSIPEIIRFISTAPKGLNEPTSREWQSNSFMYRMMDTATYHPKVRIPDAALKNIIEYWLKRWPAVPYKTMGNVIACITTTLDRFNHGRLRRAFCGRTTLVPELTFHGAVIVLAMPTLTWNEDGVIGQQLFKFIWQRAVLSRNSLEPKHRERFLFLWSDEAQDTVAPFDGEFLSLCRESKCCVTYLTQSLPAYFAKIGGDNPESAALNLVGKFTGHVFCSNSCPSTNDFAARMLGRVITQRRSYNSGSSTSTNYGLSSGESLNDSSSSNSGWSASGAASFGQSHHGSNFGSGYSSGSANNWGSNRGRGTSENVSRGYSENMEYCIEPGDFGRMLLTGGPQNGNIVTAVWFQASRVFRASGTNYLVTRFRQ